MNTPPFSTLADLPRYHAALRPQAHAFEFGSRVTTYADLDRATSRVANGLLALEPAAQTRVAVLAKNSDRFFELTFGIFKAGKGLCALNWRLAVRELVAVLQDCDASLLFVEREFAPMLDEIRRGAPTLRHVFMLDDDGAANAYTKWRDHQPDSDPRLPVDPEDVCWQLYTSGTTGHPKGVQITHRCMMQMRRLDASVGTDWAYPGARARTLIAMPNFHLAGTGWALMFLHQGATCVIQPQVDVKRLLQAIGEQHITHFFTVPAVLQMMIEDPDCKDADFRSLEVVYYGASPIAPTLLRKAMQTFGALFVQIYGMSETNGYVTCLSPTDHDPDRPELLKSCGKAYPGVEIKVLDSNGQELPQGVVGEICVRTPCIMKGYWKLPELDAQSKHGEFYRTGDAGYLDEHGYYFLVDRVKDMIVSGAENVYPIEIERALLEHPQVADVAVIGVPDPRWGEAVKAIVVRRDAAVTAADLIAFARQRIAAYKVPKSVDFVDTLPRTPAGKVLKRQLREPYWRAAGRNVG
ncbi:MAG: long-chain-fatty-acid--CoA ligase [Steroidobacteraceae bacterium]